MPELAELSTEILCLIFDHVCRVEFRSLAETWKGSSIDIRRCNPPQDIPDSTRASATDALSSLYSLCLVFRRFRDMVQPILYRSFSLAHGMNHGRLGGCEWKNRLIPFIRTVARRHDLAAVVKEVVIIGHIVDTIADDTDTWDVLQEATQSLGIDIQVAWKQRALDPKNPELPDIKNVLSSYAEHHSGSHLSSEDRSLLRSCLPREMIAILVAMLPSLSHLNLHAGHRSIDCAIPAIPRFASQILGVTSLPLKTLDTDASFLHVLSMLDLAIHLETLNLHRTKLWEGWTHSRPDYWDGLDDAVFSLPPLPKLKTLRVTEHSLDVDYLGMIMSRCTGGLESFLYEEVDPASVDWSPPISQLIEPLPPPDEVEPAKIFGHTFAHRASIKLLHLDFRNAEWESGAVPSLTEFLSLEDLFISARSWYNWTARCPETPSQLTELLPPNIQSLYLVACLRVDTPRLADELAGLVEAQRCQPRAFPKLRTIICDDCLPDLHVSGLKGVAESFADVDVDFKFESFGSNEKGKHFSFMLMREYFDSFDCRVGPAPLPYVDSDEDL